MFSLPLSLTKAPPLPNRKTAFSAQTIALRPEGEDDDRILGVHVYRAEGVLLLSEKIHVELHHLSGTVRLQIVRLPRPPVGLARGPRPFPAGFHVRTEKQPSRDISLPSVATLGTSDMLRSRMDRIFFAE